MASNNIQGKRRNKKTSRFIFRTIILAIMLAAIVYALWASLNTDNTTYKVGDQAPDFRLLQINEANEFEEIKLSDLEGKGVMINFWATYCGPCEDEIPYMQSLYDEYADKGIEIVAVSLDYTELVIHQFIDKHNINFPVVHDAKDVVRDQYKVGPIPTSYFISPDGKINEIIVGALTLDRLEGYFKDIQP